MAAELNLELSKVIAGSDEQDETCGSLRAALEAASQMSAVQVSTVDAFQVRWPA